MIITAKQIRQTMAGHVSDTILVYSYGFTLTHSITYKGWFDEALAVDSFIIKKNGNFMSSHSTLQEALDNWDNETAKA